MKNRIAIAMYCVGVCLALIISMVAQFSASRNSVVSLRAADVTLSDQQSILSVLEFNETSSTSLTPEETEVTSVIEKIATETLSVCNPSATFKSYMDYRAITNTGSPQYRLQTQATTGDYGIRTVDGRYTVAMASQYGSVGDELNITLSSGAIIYVVIGDIKGNTSCTHSDGSMIEFIVDTDNMNSTARTYGNFNTIFSGTVVNIERVL